MQKKTFVTSSSAETKKIAALLASTLKGGEVILASGPLGAGKSAFCQGLGSALGVKSVINSPSFNLLKVYQGDKLTLYHADYYRLENVDEALKDIGLGEVIGDSECVCYIEWPIYASKEILKYHPAVKIEFEYLSLEERKITIEDERE